MLNIVSKEKILEAIEYLWTEGFIDEMTRDKKYYVAVLLSKVANDYKIKLEGIEEYV
jgi:hypothetical protein